MSLLPQRGFQGGVALEGAQDTLTGSELEACDEFDIMARGDIVPGSAPAAWSGVATQPFLEIYDVGPGQVFAGDLVAVGRAANDTFYGFDIVRNVAAAHFLLVNKLRPLDPVVATDVTGAQVTMLYLPYYLSGAGKAAMLVNIGARETGTLWSSPGLLVAGLDVATGLIQSLVSIKYYDSLGTGRRSEEGVVGTHEANPLKFRGIAAYGPLVVGWGQGGDNRVMFSNIARPLKWGRDDQAAAGDRAYSDTDAIVVGAVGEIIRAGIAWRGRFWLATNRELHWVSGYGRDSFVTDGSRSAFREGVAGLHCLIEGPDTNLHGVNAEGHWVFDGDSLQRPGRKLINFKGESKDWWHLIWIDTSRADGYPGKTNQDLVWMMRDNKSQQVWIVIPYCNAATGFGVGVDTVVIKYHCLTGGYTRQVYVGRTFTAGCALPRDATAPEQRILGESVLPATGGAAQPILRYGYQSDPSQLAAMPLGTPTFSIVKTPAGPEGSAVVSFATISLSWASAALPLVFSFVLTVDGDVADTTTLTLGPVAPAVPSPGDQWLDTSGTDANLGTGLAGAMVTANADYLQKTWTGAKWLTSGTGGQKGTRASVAVPFRPVVGSRVALRVTQVSAAGRYSVVALTLDAEAGGESRP